MIKKYEYNINVTGGENPQKTCIVKARFDFYDEVAPNDYPKITPRMKPELSKPRDPNSISGYLLQRKFCQNEYTSNPFTNENKPFFKMEDGPTNVELYIKPSQTSMKIKMR